MIANGANQTVTSAMSGGNFWLAKAGYIATLPELAVLTSSTRYEAETWIGINKPKAAYRTDQWPVVGPAPWPPVGVSLEAMERELGLR